jgi:hypothetical protein
VIYAHTSALVVAAAATGPDTDALGRLLSAEPAGMLVVSALARRETAALPMSAEVRRRVLLMLDDPRVLQVETSELIGAIARSLAADLDEARRVHLATALSLRPAIVAFVCADPPLAGAARSCGLPIGSFIFPASGSDGMNFP